MTATVNQVPVIEKLKVKEAGSVELSVEMTLASVPVTVSGSYFVASNVFYPSMVTTAMPLPGEETNTQDLEIFCEMMGWDYYQTMDLIQVAVEKRGQ